MAARRLLAQFLKSQPPHPAFRIGDKSLKVSASTNTVFTRNDFFKRNIQSEAEKIDRQIKPDEGDGVACGHLNTVDENSNIEVAAVSNLKPSPRHDMAAVFTCNVCDTRSVKTFCRESYEKGVVVARCFGCNNMHLLADRLGWFGQPGSVEDLLAARGEDVKKGSADTLSLTLEDLAGMKSSKEISP